MRRASSVRNDSVTYAMVDDTNKQRHEPLTWLRRHANCEAAQATQHPENLLIL